MRFGWPLMILGIALATPAAAQQPSTDPSRDVDPASRAAAQALFEEGRVLRVGERWEEAVAKFTASHELDPAVGTLLNIADCNLALGRTASAWLHYVDAVTAARSKGDARREAYARERASALENQLVRLRIDVMDAAPDLVVTRGGLPVPPGQWSSAVPVDPGKHTVAASAPGRRAWDAVVDVTKPGGTVEVVVPALAVLPAAVAPGPRGDAPVEAEDPDTRSLVGWIVSGAGVVGLGVGVGFVVRSRMLDDESQYFCPGDPNTCTPAGAELRDDARANERVAIVAFGVGGAMLAAGAVLLVVDALDDGKARKSGAVRATRDGFRLRW